MTLTARPVARLDVTKQPDGGPYRATKKVASGRLAERTKADLKVAAFQAYSLPNPLRLVITPHSSLLTPHSSLLTPHSSLLTPHCTPPLRASLHARQHPSGARQNPTTNWNEVGDPSDEALPPE